MRLKIVVELAIIKGDHDGFFRQRLASQKSGQIISANAAVVMFGKPGHLRVKCCRRDGDEARAWADMVIHQDRNALRSFHGSVFSVSSFWYTASTA